MTSIHRVASAFSPGEPETSNMNLAASAWLFRPGASGCATHLELSTSHSRPRQGAADNRSTHRLPHMRHANSIVVAAVEDEILLSGRARHIAPILGDAAASARDTCTHERSRITRQRGTNECADGSEHASTGNDDSVRQNDGRGSDNQRAALAFGCVSNHNAERDRDLRNEHVLYSSGTMHFLLTDRDHRRFPRRIQWSASALVQR